MKKFLWVVIAVLFIAIIACGAYYYSYTHSPKYSFSMAKKALEEHDWNKFQKYVDVKGLTNNLLDRILEMAEKEMIQSEPSDEWQDLGRALSKGFMEYTRPQLVDLLEYGFKSYVESGEFEITKEVKGAFTRALSNIFEESRLKKVEVEGDTAVLELRTIDTTGARITVEVEMKKANGYWRLYKISNLEDLMR